jgi:hypothetical protein
VVWQEIMIYRWGVVEVWRHRGLCGPGGCGKCRWGTRNLATDGYEPFCHLSSIVRVRASAFFGALAQRYLNDGDATVSGMLKIWLGAKSQAHQSSQRPEGARQVAQEDQPPLGTNTVSRLHQLVLIGGVCLRSV